MTDFSRRTFGAATLAALGCAAHGALAQDHGFVRPPTSLATGAGLFAVPGGVGHEGGTIEIAYYKPKSFGPESPILLVLPGSGRNAADYRDAWIAAADARGVLVAALGYPEAGYDFAAYQLGGVVRDLQLRNIPFTADGKVPDSLHLRDEDISFKPNTHSETWLFNDFDRLFAVIAKAAGSRQPTYDIFGHSAGGQILHRLAIFRPRSKARRIVAANAGIYTLPDLGRPQPIGLGGTGLAVDDLRQAFASPLTLLLGGADNDPERGGQHLHTPLLDAQGRDRLSRGRYFYDFSRQAAGGLGAPFNWRLRVVEGVGHDYRRMSAAAADLLYGRSTAG